MNDLLGLVLFLRFWEIRKVGNGTLLVLVSFAVLKCWCFIKDMTSSTRMASQNGGELGTIIHDTDLVSAWVYSILLVSPYVSKGRILCLKFVFVFLIILTSGLQYLVQRINYKRDLQRIERIVGKAKAAAWGPKMIPINGKRKVRSLPFIYLWSPIEISFWILIRSELTWAILVMETESIPVPNGWIWWLIIHKSFS